MVNVNIFYVGNKNNSVQFLGCSIYKNTCDMLSSKTNVFIISNSKEKRNSTGTSRMMNKTQPIIPVGV
jgi:hypothetical protein